MTILFESSIVKTNKDGAVVLSTTLEKGEKLINGKTYDEVKKERTEVPESGLRAEKRDPAEATKNF